MSNGPLKMRRTIKVPSGFLTVAQLRTVLAQHGAPDEATVRTESGFPLSEGAVVIEWEEVL